MKFIKDIFLNVLSQGLFIAVQQILLFPIFEQRLGQGNFGWFLLIYGAFNVFVITVATSFTNLYQKMFNIFIDEVKTKTAYFSFYKILLLYFLFISILFSISILITNLNSFEYLLLVFLVVFTASRMFLLVLYRVQKKFSIILLINIVLSFMYASLYFFNINEVSDILVSFVIIELIINLIIFLVSKLKISKLIKSKIEKFDFLSLHFLLISGFSASLMNYSDRFVINILLGTSSIAVFYIATLPTKLMLFPFTMVSSVILSYISNTEQITKQIKNKVLLSLPLVFFVVFSFSYFIGLFLIEFLYSNYLNSVKEIYFIVTITFGFICMDYIIRSFLLKYYSLKKKAFLDTTTLILFVILSVIFTALVPNIISIAFAQLITYLLKFSVELVIFMKLKVVKIDN